MCLVLMLGLSAQTLYAQSIAVTGRVKNKNTGELLVGASVSVQGKSVALTDANGRFSLNTTVGSILEITYTGLIATKVTVAKAGELEVALEQNPANTLGDVVVIGYGTQKVTKISGAISTVKASDIEKLKPVRTEEALQGKASGEVFIQAEW